MTQIINDRNGKSFEVPFYDLKIVEIVNGQKKYAIKDNEIQSEKDFDGQKECSITFRADSNDNRFGNRLGIVHGGAILTWLDVVTSLAIYAFDKNSNLASVSVHMDADYINAAQVN